jgi:hypothetical protein
LNSVIFGGVADVQLPLCATAGSSIDCRPIVVFQLVGYCLKDLHCCIR